MLLHNPEYYFIHQMQQGVMSKPEKEFYEEKIVNSFEFLEKQVKSGVIKSYGVSSNTESCIYSATGEKHHNPKLPFNTGSNV